MGGLRPLGSNRMKGPHGRPQKLQGFSSDPEERGGSSRCSRGWCPVLVDETDSVTDGDTFSDEPSEAQAVSVTLVRRDEGEGGRGPGLISAHFGTDRPRALQYSRMRRRAWRDLAFSRPSSDFA